MKKNNYFNKSISYKLTYSIIGFLLLAFVVYGLYVNYKDSQQKQGDKKNYLDVNFLNDKKNKDPQFIDSDEDGAPDWLENLFPELDPNDPDSDNDGVLDGEYIRQKRMIHNKTRQDTTGVHLTPSEELGRGLYSAIFAVTKADGSLDTETKEKMSDNVVRYIKNLPLNSKLYLRDDIHTVLDTKESSFAYKKRMEELFKKYPINTSEITLILKAAKEPQKFQTEIEKAITKYDLYIHELETMDVPSLVAGRHTELLNAVNQLDGALKNLIREDKDDVVTLSSITQVNKIIQNVVDANTHIAMYFDIIKMPDAFN